MPLADSSDRGKEMLSMAKRRELQPAGVNLSLINKAFGAFSPPARTLAAADSSWKF